MSDQNMETQMKEAANALLCHLESGDSKAAMDTLDNLQGTLNEYREHSLFKKIGKLTRSVHEAIQNFEIEVKKDDNGEVSILDEDGSRMVDASDRLNYVIELTENAANKTMDKVEETIPISAELGETAKKLRSDWEKLVTKQMSAEEFRKLYIEMNSFLHFTVEKTSHIDSNLSEILLAQDYQDLTGQVIKRVITLVREIQIALIALIKSATEVESYTGIKTELKNKEIDGVEAEGPIINADSRSDVVSNQEDVDDLLSSLGF